MIPPTTGGGGVLPEEVVRAVPGPRPERVRQAGLHGPLSGRQIASVAFFVDGKLVKRINDTRSVYKVKICPNAYEFGRHRVVARAQFTAESGTSARRLPLTFRRCARGAVAPRFTG